MSDERGAFSGLEMIISARGRSISIGFSAKVITSEDRRTGEVFRDVEPEDLLKYGLIPEFLGRLPVPPTDSKGIGTVSVKYYPATRMMLWMVNYSGLTGNATGACFHGPASITQNAEVAVPVNGNLTGPIEGAAQTRNRDVL
jgi:hypothetical protein